MEKASVTPLSPPGRGVGERAPSLCLSPGTGERTHFSDDIGRSTGWRAHLHCEFTHADGRTRLTARRHQGPLVVQRPFYPEGDVCHVYVVHPPGGVAGGDELLLDMRVHRHAHTLITTPAATKFYKSGGRLASQSQQFDVHGDLEWLPQENIFFADSAVRLDTIVHLHGDARFIGWEIACYGRPASNETLQQGEVLQSLQLWKEGAPLLLDRTRVSGTEEMMRASWGLAGNVVLGTLLAYPFRTTEMDELRALAYEDTGSEGLISTTLVDDVLVCRATGRETEAVKRALIRVWQHLRPLVLQRSAVLPRIWAT